VGADDAATAASSEGAGGIHTSTGAEPR
jgi:hypothetical protein